MAAAEREAVLPGSLKSKPSNLGLKPFVCVRHAAAVPRSTG
jgi:hypothetical protein